MKTFAFRSLTKSGNAQVKALATLVNEDGASRLTERFRGCIPIGPFADVIVSVASSVFYARALRVRTRVLL